MKKLTLLGMILTCLLGLGLWHEQRFVAKAAPLFNTLTVINTNDNGAGSLRQAIASAASGDTIVFDAAAFATPQTINLTSGELTLDKSLTIDGPGANQLTINANGASRVFMIPSLVAYASNIVALEGLTIAGGNSAAGGGIYQGTATLTITNVSIIGNNATISGGGIYKPGGTLTVINSTIASNTGSSNAGVYNQFGTMTLTNSTVSDNFANTNGGGLANGGILTVTNSTISNNAALTSGGGIFSSGTETLNNTIVAGNLTGAGPSDIVGTIEVANNNLIGNAGSSGGIANGVNGNKVGNAGVGTLNINTIIEITLENNGGPTKTHALVPGSPALDAGSNALALDASSNALTTDQRGTGFPRTIGSAVDIGAYEAACPMLVTNINDSGAGSLRQTIADACPNATITFDTSGAFATPQTIALTSGELVIDKSLTIQGPGASQLTISGNHASRVFFVANGNTVTLDGLTVSSGNGAGAFDSGNGGGVYNSGTLTLTNCTVSGNSASIGGGIGNIGGTATITNCTVSGNAANDGAGIFNQSGTLTLTNSTVSGNTTPNKGGGIFNLGTARLINSTISGNSADQGGGIWAIPLGGPLTVTNCTITGNRADADGNGDGAGGGILVSVETLNNTIIAGNFRGTGTTPDDINATVQVANNNLIGDAATAGGLTNGVNGNKVGNSGVGTLDINTVLDTTLANNGGPTKTHRLKPSSPAIDAGSNALTLDASSNPLTTDQRGAGFPRILDGNGDITAVVDIGAFEAANTPPTITGATITRQQGSPVSSSQIATVNDSESGAGGVSVAVTSANPSNGVTVSNLVNTSGNVTADVVANCTATNASFTLTATDGNGATTTATLTVTVNANTAPTLGTYAATAVATGGSTTVTPTAAPSDNGSISSSTATAPGFTGTLAVNAAGVVSIGNAGPAGNYVVTVTLTDNCGLQTIRTFNLSVTTQFNFVGFFQPVDNLPTVNSVNAGQSIPVKFSLTGYQGMSIFATGYPTSQAITCSSGIPDPIEETATGGVSGLSYDATTDRYTYVWKTEKSWKGTCRKLVVKFTDGTTKEALFQFK